MVAQEDENVARVRRMFLFNNKYIYSVCLHRIAQIASEGNSKVLESLYNLKSIFVSPEHPHLYATGNCLIRKSDNALILGCSNSCIPYGVTSIANEAFLNCGKLTSIEIPNSVVVIGDNAFSGCYNLQEFAIPDSVLSVGDILMYCQNLRKLSIGAGLTQADFKLTDYSVFGGPDAYNNLEEICVSNENPNYRAEGNCLIEILTDTVVLGCKNSTIPQGIKSIGPEAFSCIKTDEIIVPVGVEQIEFAAFAGSTIKRCVLPNSVRKIGEKAFSRCNQLELVELPQLLEEIEPYLFHQATVQKLIIPNHLRWYRDDGVTYVAYYKINYGDVFYRDPDGTLIPPAYFGEMKSRAKQLVEELLKSLDLSASFSVLETLVRDNIVELMEHNYPKSKGFVATDNEFITTQKAYLYILMVLNKSSSLDEFQELMNT